MNLLNQSSRVACCVLRDNKPPSSPEPSQRGSALIIVLWVCLGLVAIALYFANAMNFEMRAADNRLAGVQAQLALDGAARYASNMLTTAQTPGQLDFSIELQAESVAVGESRFWFIGRTNDLINPDEPVFMFADENGKLNLNTATAEMLEWLPDMTAELAAAIVDWRDSNSEPGNGGAEDETYQRLNPPYRCKNAPFESADELRLVAGMTMEILYGEDANFNGALDPNENDGDLTAPLDDRSGTLDAGLMEYVTVWSREPINNRTNVNNRESLAIVLQDSLGTQRANEILARLNAGGGGGGGGGQTTQFGNLIEFYLTSGMTKEEFDQVAEVLVATTNTTGYIEGLVNINTASEAVLACIPGIGINQAAAVAAYRRSNAGNLLSVAWLVEALNDEEASRLAAPYVTTQTYQVSVDAAAVGRHGRGYQRTRFIFDLADGAPRAAWRQDLTHLGWALGKTAFQNRELATNLR
jgi:type II secretory pathway component PulK